LHLFHHGGHGSRDDQGGERGPGSDQAPHQH
jgi:hypothetical protein